MKVKDVKPGMMFRIIGTQGTAMIVAEPTPHPVFPALRLVIWKMPKEHPLEYSFDALAPSMELGEPITANGEALRATWRSEMIW